MSVNKFLVPILAVSLFLGTVGVAMANGNWIVSGKQMVDLENLASSADIKGGMTLQQVADGLGLSTTELYALAAIPAELPPETALKEMEGMVPDFEVTTLREAVAAYLGEGGTVDAEAAGMTSVDDASVSGEAVNAEYATPAAQEPVAPAAEPTASATPEPASETTQEPAVRTDHVPQGDGASEGDGTGPTAVPAGMMLAADQIKGKHTLQAIVDEAQAPLDELLAALNLPATTDPGATVKELVDQGLVSEVDDVRAAVADLQGK
jgi:hypothetical protein